MGRVPGGWSGVAHSVAPQAGCETERGVFQITAGIFTRPRAIVHGFIVDLGHRDGGRSLKRASRAHGTASLRSVGTWSLAFWGISDGATTQQSSSLGGREWDSQEPRGPATETKTRGVAVDGLVRMS
jgi:hypothetical protein